MTIAKAQLIDALRLRYDHHSAEAVFDIARQRVEIEDKHEYSVKEAKSLRAAIELSGDRVGAALAAIDELLGGGGGDDSAAPAKAAPAKAEPAKPEKSDKSDKSDKVEAAKPEKSDKAEAAKADKSDKAQAAKPEPAKTEKSDKTEPARADKSDKTEAAKADKSDKTQTAKVDGAKAQDVEIVLTGLQVADGEQVLVCGAFDELGDWDPAKARPLVKKGDTWLTTVKLHGDAKVAFKFLRRTADGKVTWESGDDRYLTAPRVEATWR